MQHTNTSSMSGDSTTSLFCREVWARDGSRRLDEERRAFERLGKRAGQKARVAKNQLY